MSEGESRWSRAIGVTALEDSVDCFFCEFRHGVQPFPLSPTVVVFLYAGLSGITIDRVSARLQN